MFYARDGERKCAITLEDGLPVTIAAGRCGWSSHPVGGVNRLVLVGSEGTAVVPLPRFLS
jgi:hypothetical protein